MPDDTPALEPETRASATTPQDIVEIEHYELDGIPLFHLPSRGATILSLSFRVGRADEPVPMGGMTHLAEHLLLRSIGNPFDHSNGTTEAYRVTFIRRGSPREASQFLRDICAAIEKPPLHRMRDEANILRTEAAGRQGAMPLALRLLWFRTGYQGIGTMNLPELFLDHLDNLALKSWIAEHFVSGNAAIWIAGELPDDLLVSLPEGPRKPPPVLPTFRGFETPTIVWDEAPGVGASFEVDRNVATATAFRCLSRHMLRTLRVERGMGYDVGTEYLPADGNRAFVAVWATSLPADITEVGRIFSATMQGLAAQGADENELHLEYETAVRDLSDPLAFPARLDHHVANVLLGRDPTPDLVVLDEQARLRSDQVAEEFRKAMKSMLMLVPPGGYVPDKPEFKPYPGPDAFPVGKNRRYDLVGPKRGAPWSRGHAPKLIVAEEGVAVDDSRGRRLVGIRWDDCVVVLKDKGRRSLLSKDGSGFDIEQEAWKNGSDAVRQIDRIAPLELIVTLT